MTNDRSEILCRHRPIRSFPNPRSSMKGPIAHPIRLLYASHPARKGGVQRWRGRARQGGDGERGRGVSEILQSGAHQRRAGLLAQCAGLKQQARAVVR